jgi:hypothetical protein
MPLTVKLYKYTVWRMPCIRRAYHYAVVYLSPEVCFGKMPLCGQSVEVIKGGAAKNTPFYGFTNLQSLADKNAMLITGLTGYSPSNEILGPWLELKRTDVYLGEQERDGVKLVVEKGKPVRVAFEPLQSDTEAERPNNVTRIRP